MQVNSLQLKSALYQLSALQRLNVMSIDNFTNTDLLTISTNLIKLRHLKVSLLVFVSPPVLQISMRISGVCDSHAKAYVSPGIHSKRDFSKTAVVPVQLKLNERVTCIGVVALGDLKELQAVSFECTKACVTALQGLSLLSGLIYAEVRSFALSGSFCV